MSRMKGYLAMAMAMSMMAGKMPMLEKEPVIVSTEKRPPAGTKEYFFNALGEFSTDKMLKSECVFKCVAINDKSAVKKFNKWKLKGGEK